MSITSDELNFLVYRYLHESGASFFFSSGTAGGAAPFFIQLLFNYYSSLCSDGSDNPRALPAGFRHSAFTFGAESAVAKSNINGAKIPPGQLINFVQKGIMYAELERSVSDNGNDPSGGTTAPFALRQPPGGGGASSSSNDGPPAKKQNTGGSNSGGGGQNGTSASGELSHDQVTTLSGHQSEVFICAWNPTSLLLASGSGDSTARIWRLPSGPCGDSQAASMPAPAVLQHFANDKEKSKDVTTLDWNHDGTALATGSYDGQARIWSPSGKLTSTLSKHKGPIFSLRWNKSGRYLLSGSVDKTAIIWDASTGEVKQQFAFHKEPTLDVDWRDEDSFASCSTDKQIYVCKLGQPQYLQHFSGHSDEVNAIRWDPSGQLLASCSDDHTAKIWSMGNSRCSRDLKLHTKEIYTIKWSPTGSGSKNPNLDLVLASASFDSTVRIWDPITGSCKQLLDKHT